MHKFGLGKLFGAVLAGLLLTSPAAADQPPPTITKHQIKVSGAPLDYTAEVGRVAIRDVLTGQPRGSVFYVAYRAQPQPGKIRPLAFIWNGGPGLPAASLEFEGAGPLRIEKDVLIDNADTWLTDSDLVFMDPVGTGFSRAVSAEAQKDFTSIIGDVGATTEFVRAWLLQHGDEATPLIIAGQSYGAGRAGATAYRLIQRGFDVRGLAIISNTTGLPAYPDQERVARALHVGDYAVAALHFKKLPPAFGTTPEQARMIGEAWARETYLPALRRLDTLSVAERGKLVAELAAHIGLHPGQIDPKTASVTQGDFLGGISPDKLPYYSDYRIFEPYKTPSLDLGIRYIRHDLHYPSDLPYLPLEPYEQGFAPTGTYPKSINSTWTHSTIYGATPEQLAGAAAAFEKTGAIGIGHFGPNLPSTAEAIALKPSLKVLVAHGAYDPLGGCSIDAEHGRRLQPPYRAAISFRCYLSGHAIYRDAPARAQFANDMRALARAATGQTR
jgi:carboxypeptidase C (cathepsin A)